MMAFLSVRGAELSAPVIRTRKARQVPEFVRAVAQAVALAVVCALVFFGALCLAQVLP